MLRGDQWFPRWTPLSVTIENAIAPAGADFAAAVRLRDAVRAVILAGCGEPDLVELIKPAKPGERRAVHGHASPAARFARHCRRAERGRGLSLLMGMSSAMIYGLLPVFLVTVLGASTLSVGLIEGLAEATTSLLKIFSGVASDWVERRPPQAAWVVGLCALGGEQAVVSARRRRLHRSARADRRPDRQGHSGRAARCAADRRDAFRNSRLRLGLRLALYTIGAVAGTARRGRPDGFAQRGRFSAGVLAGPCCPASHPSPFSSSA